LAPDSFAIALANIVLPQPGGPYNNIPFGLLNKDEVCENTFGYTNGYITFSLIESIISFKPPISRYIFKYKNLFLFYKINKLILIYIFFKY